MAIACAPTQHKPAVMLPVWAVSCSWTHAHCAGEALGSSIRIPLGVIFCRYCMTSRGRSPQQTRWEFDDNTV